MQVSINKIGQETTVVPVDPRGAFTSGSFSDVVLKQGVISPFGSAHLNICGNNNRTLMENKTAEL